MTTLSKRSGLLLTTFILMAIIGVASLGLISHSDVVEIDSTTPELRFVETDQTDPAGRFRTVVRDNQWILENPDSPNWGDTATNARLTIDDTGGRVSSVLDTWAIWCNPVAGGDCTNRVGNNNCCSSLADAKFHARTKAGDVFNYWEILGVVNWTLGIDNSHPDNQLVFSRHNRPGNDNAMAFRQNPLNQESIVVLSSHMKAETGKEVGYSVTDEVLTVGSEGSMIIPTATVCSDATAGNVDGAICIDSDDHVLRFRSGGIWR